MTNSESSSSDGMLLQAIQAGNESAFEELVSRYQRPLWRVARSRLGRDDWSDDVVQETLLCVVRWLHTYDSRFSFRTWLWTILLNQCSRYLKKQSRSFLAAAAPADSGDLERELGRQLQAELSPPQQLVAKERGQLLDALLLRLPEVQADALRLRFFGGLKFPEIADTMQCSLSTAKNRVKWGLLKLADMMGPAGEYAGWRTTLGDVFHDERD